MQKQQKPVKVTSIVETQADHQTPPTTNMEPLLPTLTFQSLYHIGTLNPDNQGNNYSYSYEGPGLSVSLHPDEWRSIAKLGGQPTWIAHKQNNKFLNRWALTEKQEYTIHEWGLTNGLLEYATRWEVRHWDSESENEYYFYCKTQEEALDEADTDDNAIKETRMLVATEQLAELTGVKQGETVDVFDLVLNIYTQRETQLDGIWWEDTYEPLAYSCPRGVILPEMTPTWSFTKVNTTHENN